MKRSWLRVDADRGGIVLRDVIWAIFAVATYAVETLPVSGISGCSAPFGRAR
jgi:hypothetical protein